MLKETFKGFLIEKKLKKNIFLVSKNDIKYIVKIKYNPRIEKKYLSIFIDKLGLTNIHFNKELSILKYLTNQEFLNFKYPKLFETDNKTYFIIDFIDGKKEWNINEINR